MNNSYMYLSAFKPGDIVYLITDVYQLPRMIIEVIFGNGHIKYFCSSGAEDSTHYEMEITKEKQVI